MKWTASYSLTRPVDVEPIQEVLDCVWNSLRYVSLLVQLNHCHCHLGHCVQVASSDWNRNSSKNNRNGSCWVLECWTVDTWWCWWLPKTAPDLPLSLICPRTSPFPWWGIQILPSSKCIWTVTVLEAADVITEDLCAFPLAHQVVWKKLELHDHVGKAGGDLLLQEVERALRRELNVNIELETKFPFQLFELLNLKAKSTCSPDCHLFCHVPTGAWWIWGLGCTCCQKCIKSSL